MRVTVLLFLSLAFTAVGAEEKKAIVNLKNGDAMINVAVELAEGGYWITKDGKREFYSNDKVESVQFFKNDPKKDWQKERIDALEAELLEAKKAAAALRAENAMLREKGD